MSATDNTKLEPQDKNNIRLKPIGKFFTSAIFTSPRFAARVGVSKTKVSKPLRMAFPTKPIGENSDLLAFTKLLFIIKASALSV
ncbi:hypothetical protein [Pseudomonas fluorescens]|uniref:hypothetical protein n=1 Tax=Pseudomonas fluorescens TaxID=294 RepID=UPI00123EF873|nr:hypothetical protein [Pseudomonas fluorescens]